LVIFFEDTELNKEGCFYESPCVLPPNVVTTEEKKRKKKITSRNLSHWLLWLTIYYTLV